MQVDRQQAAAGQTFEVQRQIYLMLRMYTIKRIMKRTGHQAGRWKDTQFEVNQQ
jgi:histone H3/H4